MADYGGINDGQCEYSFFSRCPNPAEGDPITYGQQSGWTYRYCVDHQRAYLEAVTSKPKPVLDGYVEQEHECGCWVRHRPDGGITRNRCMDHWDS